MTDEAVPAHERVAELEASVAAAREAIDSALVIAGRAPGSVEIVAVTKKFPVADVAALAQLGIRHFGENRLQEAAAKHSALPDANVTWHFVGQLQTNKARAVAAFIDQVDTVDRLSLVAALERGAVQHGRTIDCLVQVNLDPHPTSTAHRGGCHPDEARALADAIDSADHLRLRGVMGMAPMAGDAAAAFNILAAVSEHLRLVYPQASEVSAGMSGDFSAAIAAGATQVRLGTAILGVRPTVG